MMNEWQDIDTAPMDGTHVLVAFGPYDQWTTFAQKPPTVAHWFDPPVVGVEGGWYLSVSPFEQDSIMPTHWMPLPEPPK